MNPSPCDPGEDNGSSPAGLMAGHVLEKVQLDAFYSGQRRVSQAAPHGAAQPEIINELVPAVASRRVAVEITKSSSV